MTDDERQLLLWCTETLAEKSPLPLADARWLNELLDRVTPSLPATKPHEMSDPVVKSVCDVLMERSFVGFQKYGVGLDRTDLSLRDWLIHMRDELLDAVNYAQRMIMELDDGLKQQTESPRSL